jgi:transcriptional regulator with XRE-family HTH domain
MDIELRQSIGEALKKARKANGITQKYISEQTGYSRADYSKLEKGLNNITLDRLSDICKVVGLKIELK